MLSSNILSKAVFIEIASYGQTHTFCVLTVTLGKIEKEEKGYHGDIFMPDICIFYENKF
jgi:hypothetical protein